MLIIFEISGLALCAGCGDSSAPMPNGPSTTPLSITFAPFSNNCSGVRCVQIGGMEQFSVSVSCAIGVTCPLASSQGVTWSVAGTGCSGASCGTIDATGKYSAPATVPNPDAVVTVTARSVADPRYFASVTIAIVTVLGESFSFSLNPTSVVFGNQMVNTTSAPRAVALTNTGSTPQPVSARMNGGNFADFAQTNDCPSMIAVGASCTFNISFRPGATGSRGGILVVGGTFEEEGFVNLIGTGTN